MPELPEVETIRKQLQKEIVGLSITDIWTDTPKMIRPSPAEVLKRVKGQKITAAERRAKLLIFRLSGEENLVLHLRLSGQLFLHEPDDSRDPFLHVILRLSNDKELHFNDQRKFGYVSLVDSDAELEKLVAGYGPEPLDDLTEEQFAGILSGSNRRIKDLLMDQKKISGVGNIYANEALWLAKVHPEVKASSLSDSQTNDLYKAVLKVLKDGLRLGGATISDEKYRNLYGERGNYEQAIRVYQRKGQPCLRCKTKIEYLKVGQRGTFICPKEQKI
ncbi:MAG TPA: bifunctional DNA-formamidopyrimidine glycosylase/DNA-(apurinic or apyrimidinic site) lyase [candidate division WWE3 bacterium]|uniref:Bifunctional DNA-formamidopyrimidine glycosylase/DNA-(Apurinic or apyrimidinic site) lyase n=1 Tax=candidate division WWE3 bacterium TaxID=2053526 RepID=A0A7C1SV52_UNCKA|nr:bifunctional DNA-formamidopyrimidine glycosylase/DNA-(apurinic or apyrimidinic site) lyase [candidate division WWE3 bacterium]